MDLRGVVVLSKKKKKKWKIKKNVRLWKRSRSWDRSCCSSSSCFDFFIENIYYEMQMQMCKCKMKMSGWETFKFNRRSLSVEFLNFLFLSSLFETRFRIRVLVIVYCILSFFVLLRQCVWERDPPLRSLVCTTLIIRSLLMSVSVRCKKSHTRKS